LNKLLIYALCFLLCVYGVYSECSPKINGCDSRYKFMSYVTSVDKIGDPVDSPPILEYRIVYLYTNRIVFYKSKDQSPMLKNDDLNDSPAQIEANIERVIYYGEIILECGGSLNKLCHVGQITDFEN